MRYVTLLKANIKKQTGSFFGIFILIFIITVSLCGVLAIWSNSRNYVSKQMDRVGFGDITSWVLGRDTTDNLKEQIEGVEETDKAEIQEVIFVNYHVNGYDAGVNGLIAEYNPKQYDYYIYNENLTEKEKSPVLPEEGEVYVSPSFTSLYDAEIGDKVEIEITGEKDVYTFVIAGFFEDPFMGSSMTGMKTMLINETDIQKLEEKIKEAGENAVSGIGNAFHIFMDKESDLTVSEYQILLNEQTDLKNSAWFTYQKSAMIGFMLILQNIFAGFLLVFVLGLFIAAILVISHSIISSIEQDYTDMGILKAVGFTQADLQISKALQYVSAILLGMGFGIPFVIPVVNLVNRITVTATGLMVPSKLPAGLCAGTLLSVLLVLTLVIFGKTAKIGKISPVRAIRGGAEDVYFKSRFTTPIGKKGLNLHLALRQLVSGKKQYISACLVTVLLVFFLSLVGRIAAWMGNDGEGLMNSLGACPYDIGIKCSDDLAQETRELVSSYAGIVDSYEFKIERAVINNIDYMMNVISKPEYYNIVEGRACLYDNEVVLTELVADELDVKIGDTVCVTFGEKTEEFLVTGINQCVNDMGANFSVSKEGYLRFGEEGKGFYTYYILEDTSKQKELVEVLAEKYGEQVMMDENTWSGLESIVLAMDAVGILMYVITMIFILIVIVMTGSKILYREQKDLGIYKSLGFDSRRLRLTFSLRFGIVAVIGSVFGIAVSVWVADGLVEMMLKFCGISKFESHLNIFELISPAVVVAVLFMLFAYIAARKIKRVEPRNLIDMS